MNTIENNKIIAEFLGNKPSNNGLFTIKGKTTRPSELQYHSDWNWLMEVVEKIESLEVEGKQWSVLDDEGDVLWNFEVDINSKQCTINRCAFDGDEEDFLGLYDCRNYENLTKIEAVYNACLEFIKWYNEQKN